MLLMLGKHIFDQEINCLATNCAPIQLYIEAELRVSTIEENKVWPFALRDSKCG